MKIFIQYTLFIYLSFLGSGCKKFIELDPPNDQLISSTVFVNNETANAAVLGVYSSMISHANGANSFLLGFLTGLYGDELTNNNPIYQNTFYNSINPANNTEATDYWKGAYKIIYLANSVYEGCEMSTKLLPQLKKQLMGEAQVIRAYFHFNLVNLYGDIPIVLTTNYPINSQLPRSQIEEVYEQIIFDLKRGLNNLNKNYVGTDGLTASIERVRINQSVAAALLAKVYLYVGDYTSAEAISTALILDTVNYKLQAHDDVFLKNSKEAIWQLMPPDNSSSNTLDGGRLGQRFLSN
jgi:hypothetical protein